MGPWVESLMLVTCMLTRSLPSHVAIISISGMRSLQLSVLSQIRQLPLLNMLDITPRFIKSLTILPNYPMRKVSSTHDTYKRTK